MSHENNSSSSRQTISKSNQPSRPYFAHERLVAYQVAREWQRMACEIVKGLPRGFGHIVDDMKRASTSITHNIAEGACRRGKDPARFFNYSKTSVDESGASIDSLVDWGAIDQDTYDRARAILCRLNSLVAGLEGSARGS